jgi:glyoxylase-like metal-dependent hydrolase (beta-lactamase superfamily II)
MTLSVNVFNSGYLSVNSGPGWDGPAPATWPASTATLVSGDREAVLIDALMTIDEGHQLVSWIRGLGKNVTHIVITHGHGDHFFGAGPVLAAFPGAQLVALDKAVVEEAAAHLEPPVLQNWLDWFGDRFDRRAAIPRIGPAVIELEGHPVRLLAVGDADGTLGTVVHVPELDLVVAGDAVYNGIHMWLWNSTPQSRHAWLRTIDAVAELHPTTIIAGHQDPSAPDNDAVRQLAESREYIKAFEAAVAESTSPGAVIDAMTAAFPGRGNPYTLFLAAHSQFPQEA